MVITMAEQNVLFYVGTGLYGVDIRYVKGIEKYANIVPVPDTPNYIEGIINLRGELIPIFSLRSKFGMPKAAPTEETKLIIINSNNMLVAFEVDCVAEIMTMENEHGHAVPNILKNQKTDYAGKIVHTKKGVLAVLLDMNGILTEEERAACENTLEKTKEMQKKEA